MRVFLSSTFRDLTRYRDSVYRAIQRMDDWHCVRMEDFGALDWEADEFCRQRVSECDLFVGILGIIYGSIHKPSGLSLTEREYQAAVDADKSRLMFLTPDDFAVPGNLMESSAKQRKQRAFRTRVNAERVGDADWTSPDQLATSVVTAIRNWEQGQPRRKASRKTVSPPPPTSSQQLRDRYLHWMAQTCGRLVLRGIQSPGQTYIELNLDDIYVPLEAVEVLPVQERRAARSSKREAEMLEHDQPATRPINLKDLLQVGDRIVVIGGPGSGKSTVLQHIAWTLAESLSNNQPGLAGDRLGLIPPLPLPILIPLHAFAEHRARHANDADPERTTLAACLHDYLTRDKAASGLSLDFCKSLLESKEGCLVLLDGLDEVASDTERELVSRAVESLVDWMPGNRYVVTSRPAAYSGESVIAAGFREVRVKPLEHSKERDDVAPLVTRLYEAADHAERIRDLLDWLDQLETRQASRVGGDERRLINSPLMVRMVAIVDLSGEKLPEQRAELYDRFVDALLRATHHPHGGVRPALENLGEKAPDQRQWLAVLAYDMHCRKDGTRSVEEDRVQKDLQKHLVPTLGKVPAADAVKQFIAAIRGRGGLIEVRAGRPDRWSFTHHPFQEFLAAVYLADIVDEVDLIASELEKENRLIASWWQEVALLLLGYLSAGNPNKANRLARRLARLPENIPPDWPPLAVAAELAGAERVAMALTERREALPQLQEEVAQRLVVLLKNPVISDAPPILRAAAGRALASLGDPRPEVMTVAAMQFCFVPAGPFIMGGDENHDEKPQHKNELGHDYWMARYPITNAQFQEFVAAGGYQKQSYWIEAKQAEVWKGGKVKGRYEDDARDRPYNFGEPFNLPNHPVVGVTWYEALAFTRWLSAHLREANLPPEGWEARLPSEEEWEKAARGGVQIPDKSIVLPMAEVTTIPGFNNQGNPEPHREYPWGAAPDPNLMNVAETLIGNTSAVGCFPLGASECGCEELSGNVWEWTRSLWGKEWEKPEFKYPYNAADGREHLTAGDDVLRVLRGGSFNHDARIARCASRYWYYPLNWGTRIGFRVVLSPFL